MKDGSSNGIPAKEASQALWVSTAAFTICFAVWTIFAIIGVRIKQELGLNEAQFGLLVGTPILSGSLSRILLGVWTTRYGGRVVYTATMLAAALATFLLAYATTFPQMLLAGFCLGLAGGSFAVGVAYVSPFFPPEKQGTALGIFGAGNVGAALTKFLAPLVLAAYGWQAVAEVWAAALVLMALVFWFTTTDDPAFRERRLRKEQPRSFLLEFAPLKDLQVWRFSLYYFFSFGGFVALSLWLPRYLVGVYGFGLESAGMLAAAYSIPGSIFRAYGGALSDRIGARKVMYMTLAVASAATLILSLPPAMGPQSGPLAISSTAFVIVLFVLGFFMSLGKAAVYKHIPAYYPASIGAVGGVVGMMGGLGGFVLPIAFGLLKDFTGLWSSCFMLLFLIVAVSLVWMHLSIRQMQRRPAFA
ncbi:MFS transporter [Phyllobacterium endophyticum]|uniref:MFS transporter n=1 Tax=Phyllobacterium endophyticum TaxID=1149773 RepID=A0A2P7AZU0_9HYPH|nr:nitrate/nitrite transporter [Phyllobacterium endophyticum]MBB3235640.1 NNP family nitrate/nitrite transporter-like MFS transporter [Phyllobacterium endophyticum]PSH59737.1 MFS transporter [Phyllobacterium endophyticum]TYR41883.1 NarK/NasA family nitrate transporter [Phyllobacterium endophyticum]